MIELTELLKELKKITADSYYTARVRAYFVQEKESRPIVRLTLAQLIFNTFQTSSAIVLAGILMLAALGGLSLSQFWSPVKLTSLDPVGIRVEAQAIDIQIQLSNLNYTEILNPELTIETSTAITATGNPQSANPRPKETVSAAEPLTINAALDKLAE